LRCTLGLFALAALAAGPASANGDPLSPIDSGSVTVIGRSFASSQPNVFGTVALDAGVTPYGARWRRVSAADERDPRVRALGAAAAAASADPLAQLALVHDAVTQRVRWSSDLETYRVSDYWAQAGETLSRGQGDSEDIAVLTMQVLKAAGFPARDIYLSIGRDRQRGADSLLLVRIAGQFYALDDRRPRPELAQARARFTPIFTLGKNSAWIHGSRVATRGGPRGVRTALAR
jgi:predicted transglutaminase-like cysteine proteinase